MKKRSKIISALVAPAFVSSLPLLAVSCNHDPEPPQPVFDIAGAVYNTAIDHFMNICTIPHITNHADDPDDPNDEDHTDSLIGISNYVKTNARKTIDSSKITTDAAGNIWYDIPASEGYENYKPLILQSHLDMVWASQGEAESWNKWTHPVSEPVIETIDGYEVMHSKDYLTNLGVDNGNGVALMVSLTEHCNDFKHGKIRCIYTVNEEGSNCPGAEDLGWMLPEHQGERINPINHEQGFDWLINLDGNMATDRADVIFNSAGGFRVQWNVNQLNPVDVSGSLYRVELSGCKGGHSGLNINDGLANPINLLAKIFLESGQSYTLADIKTQSNSDTSIPNGVAFIVDADGSLDEEVFKELLDQHRKDYFGETEKMNISVTPAPGAVTKTTNLDFTSNILNFLKDMPYGPIGGICEDDETATKWSCNTGLCDLTLSKETNPFSISAMARCQQEQFVPPAKDKYIEIITQYATILENHGFLPDTDPEKYIQKVFTPWEGKKESWICQKCWNVYESLGFTPYFRRIHGGLECGDFVNLNENLQQISIGPLNEAEHGVRENLYLITYKGVIETIIEIINKMNEAQ